MERKAIGFGPKEAPQEDAEEEAQEAPQEDSLGTPAQEVGPTRVITFSSDYGPTDEFVGVCRLVILTIAPDARVIDVSHGIRGVRAGSVVLAQSLIEAPEGAVHLAVVDPGVGSERRAVVLACENGSDLVGPDNGLFFPIAELFGGVRAAYELADLRYRGPRQSRTFHGRDIFAPAAAHLARGVAPSEFGPPIPPADLVRLPAVEVEVSTGLLSADVARTDWFGNVQLAATAEDINKAELSGDVVVSGASGSHRARIGEKFSDVGTGELVVYVNSAGFVAIARNQGSAADVVGDSGRMTIVRAERADGG